MMKPLSDTLIYQVPGDNDETITIRVTAAEAIAQQRATAASVRPDFSYESDEQALEDFITIHWAWWE
jgi:hypothetical protein